ncbi:hypothetical protein LSTR_LSTR017567 [Laodelphax striatellus]|uniref:cytochrome-b5 reductase n=1 Tax=Laodelphax striatellus TaxID=195883 RepID=A0A482WLZ9_LAOST|nr:hypothetical protein LSTR_LSTR017567 [Laodelphax striatellus]
MYDEEDQPPTEEDCCNSGCSPCVFDIYEKRKEEKKKKKGEEQLRYDLLSQTSFKPFILLEKRDFSGCYSRLTFQPFVPKTEIEEKHSKNIVLESDLGLGNMMSRVEKTMEFEVISEENSGNMISENDTENIGLDRNKGHENVIGRVGKGFEVISNENKDSENITLEGNKCLENVMLPTIEKKGFEVISNETQDSEKNIFLDDSENIDLDGNKDYQNLASRVGEKGFEVISKENQGSDHNMVFKEDYESIVLDGNKDYQNVASRVGEKGFEVISNENQDSDQNMVLEEDSENIVLDGNKYYQNVASRVGRNGFEVISKETQVLDNMISDTKEDEMILEQQINGYLPYKPGQHLTMKSWRIGNSENQKKTRKEDQQMEELNRESYQDTPRRKDSLEDPKTADTKFGRKLKVTDQSNLLKTSVSEQAIMGTDVTYQDIQEDSLADPKSAGTKFGQDSKMRDQNLPKNPTSEQTIMGTVVTYQDIQEDPKSASTKFGQDSNMRDQNLPENPTSKQTIMGTTKPNFITRDYTPITLAKISSNCCFEIIVKYYEDGEMSKYLKSLKNGDKVLFRGPYGEFDYLKNHKHVLGICMGTGLAPIFAVFRQILDDESDETFLKLLYGCKDPDGILMRTELREMAKFWNFRAEIFLTSGALESGAKFGENFQVGRITRNCVFENLKPNQLVLVCGSETFNSEVVHWLAEFDRWEVEYFVF